MPRHRTARQGLRLAGALMLMLMPLAACHDTPIEPVERGAPVRPALAVQGSFADKGVADAPWAYTIGWGDGTPATTGTAMAPGALPPASHVYAKAGTFRVALIVRDKDGAAKTSNVITVTVAP